MDKYTLGEVAYKNGYEKGFQDGIKHEKQVRENNNYTYQVKMSKEDMNKIPVLGKEKLKESKDCLKKMGIVDTNSKEYIEIQAYKEFADKLKEKYINDKRYDRPNAHTLIDMLFANIDKTFKELTERKED